MDDVEIRLQCVELASAGDVRTTLIRAAEIYEWVTEKENKPKRGRPPKSSLTN